MYENQNTQAASGKIEEMIGNGFSYAEIVEFLKDGEGLEKEGLTDQALVEEMYALATEQSDNEKTAKLSD